MTSDIKTHDYDSIQVTIKVLSIKTTLLVSHIHQFTLLNHSYFSNHQSHIKATFNNTLYIHNVIMHDYAC